MAYIPLPAVMPTKYTLGLMTPGRVTLRSLSTGRDFNFGRGVSYWTGSVSYGPYSSYEAQRDALNAVLSTIASGDHTFDFTLPDREHQSDRFPVDTELTLMDADPAPNAPAATVAQITLSVRADTFTRTGLLAGDYITIDNQLYRCVTNQVVDTVLIAPGRIIGSIGSAVDYATPSVRCRGTGEMLSTEHNIDGMESVTLNWRSTDG